MDAETTPTLFFTTGRVEIFLLAPGVAELRPEGIRVMPPGPVAIVADYAKYSNRLH